MKKLIISIIISTLTLNFLVFADDEFNEASIPLYKNLREGQSEFISSSRQDEIEDKYKGTREIEILRSIMSDQTVNRCATKVIDKIKERLQLNDEDDIKLAILGLRLDDSLDDVSASILIKANELNRKMAVPFAKDGLDQDDEKKALGIFQTEVANLKNKSLCIEDSYRALVAKLVTDTPKFAKSLKHINKIAHDNDLINDSEFKKIEILRIKKVHEWPITLSEYAQRLSTISKKFSNRKKESSQLVTQKKFKQKVALRRSLYEKYDSTQIILLANLVKELKARLESKNVTISINYDDRPSEVISLSPMEKFRFILKLLRKELATINNSSLLNGRTATYLDLITASYEVGYINSDEIEQLASLQEIWNPSKTTKEKVMFWVKTFGGVASVLLPEPFGFVSVMAIMLIDQQIQSAPVDSDPDFNLF